MKSSLRILAFFVALPTAVSPAQNADPAPKPLFGNIAPVRSVESLTNVALPNTTIDSVVTNADGSCRISATVTHPPSGDRVGVFIALPMKGWNGRFQGTGGGGVSGGGPFGSVGTCRQCFASAAPGAGHEGPDG